MTARRLWDYVLSLVELQIIYKLPRALGECSEILIRDRRGRGFALGDALLVPFRTLGATLANSGEEGQVLSPLAPGAGCVKKSNRKHLRINRSSLYLQVGIHINKGKVFLINLQR